MEGEDFSSSFQAPMLDETNTTTDFERNRRNKAKVKPPSRIRCSHSMNKMIISILLYISALLSSQISPTYAKLADRSRVVKHRKEQSNAVRNMNSRLHTTQGVTKSTKPFKKREDLPINGSSYRRNKIDFEKKGHIAMTVDYGDVSKRVKKPSWKLEMSKEEMERYDLVKEDIVVVDSGKSGTGSNLRGDKIESSTSEFERKMGQLSGCCTDYQDISAKRMCYKYGQDCSEGQYPSHDSGDDDCTQAGLSFIGVSFSVNTAHGNPFSYQLCDQYPMENLLDRNYDYVMSMDEDGWLVGGGYKSFDYSGKMPYIDSSHTELLRIGSVDTSYGGTSIAQVYAAMYSLSFPPFSIFPEYVKGGGGGSGSGDGVPSGDVTLIVSVVPVYSNGGGEADYEMFLDDLFNAMDKVGGGPCMDDHDTDPHVSMARGVKFKSSYHETQYFYTVNLEVAVWQAMYPNGVVIGSSGKANFPPENAGKNQKYIGYGNLYFFFDRANITTAFPPSRGLTDDETYYATMYNKGLGSSYYQKVTTIDFDYSGSGSGNNEYYEHNPYGWDATMAKHDMTDGWDLPPDCQQEGEAFFGIPMSRNSDSKLMSTKTFQNQFDFEVLLDRNFTYMKKFGTNHGWLVGEQIGNGAGSIVDKDTAHIPLFYMGTTNPNMGGMSLSDMVKIAKALQFGSLYIKPAFVFQDDDGSVKLQFEADSKSALGYLYDNLCKMVGISWNGQTPYNDMGVYTNCAMHSAGDRAQYGCGPNNGNKGGFCPQMTLAYRVGFDEDNVEGFFQRGNNYVDYWRSLYPSGVAVGTDSFCRSGGCLGLFLNRYDLYNVYSPDMGGSWVEYNGGTMAPTISPAPSYAGGCDDPRNFHLDVCYRMHHGFGKRHGPAWHSLGALGQFSILLVGFMVTSLSLSVAVSKSPLKKRKRESYAKYVMRHFRVKKRKPRKKKSKRNNDEPVLCEDILSSDILGDGSEFASALSPRSLNLPALPSPRTLTSCVSPTAHMDNGENYSSTTRSFSRENERSEKSKRKRKKEKSRTKSRGRDDGYATDDRSARTSRSGKSGRSSRSSKSRRGDKGDRSVRSQSSKKSQRSKSSRSNSNKRDRRTQFV
eukprot:CAMPEP_0178976576 /NCGR_PEP_ID=MMETSP0789-20121207/23923_1 /TAXON_ID=3005 /ORGANISM="Rhizosolenia setigera, Strain CCMP 1694" /LENGTH=1098 /DNA_ID=CAMNT_0020665705 /DNA_START=17 /DNA_END=3313 /DNA_ORIENTATION=+